MIWHTSDWHLDHSNIIKYDKRPDVDVNAMNQRIIETTNKYVMEDDWLVYHGDFLMSKSIDRDDNEGYVNLFKNFLDQLRCKNLIFIAGNHDNVFLKKHGEQRHNWPLWDLFTVWQCNKCDTVYDPQGRFKMPKECPRTCEGDFVPRPIYNIHPMGYELRLTKKICAQHGIQYENKLIVCTHYSQRVWNKSHRGSSINLYGHSHGSLPGIRNSFDVGFNVWNRPLSLLEILDELMPAHNRTEQGQQSFGGLTER